MANDFSTVKQRVIDIVKNETGIELTTFNPDEDILEQINLDSMQLLEIYAAIIDEFGIEIPITIINLKTLNGITSSLVKEIRKSRTEG